MVRVTLTTDFGTQDGYVGAMKGVIASGAPMAQVVDLTHEIPPQDVAAGAFALAQACPFFPAGTIHVAVVDPGVGGARRGVVISDGRQLYVGPDNGVFSLVVPEPVGAWEIVEAGFRRGTVAATFHGRDVFASAAAALAAGRVPSAVGPAVVLEGRLDGAADDGGRVVHIDRFGNAITSIPGTGLPADARVRVGSVTIRGISPTYETVARGRVLAYVGSAGTLELAVREGSFARKHRVKRGTRVTVSAKGAR